MISLVTNEQGVEIGYLVEDLFIPMNTVKAVIDGKFSYDTKETGFFEKGKFVVPKQRKKYNVLSKEYTEKAGLNYISLLKRNNITLKRYAFIGATTDETHKNCEHYIWDLSDFPYRYSIYDTKTDKKVGYLLTSTDLYSPNEANIHICMIEITEKGQGIGTQVIRDLLKYRSIRGLSDNNSKPFWNRFDVKYLSDNMHFNIES